MFTRAVGIMLGAFLAYTVTKGLDPTFDLQTWLGSLAH